LELISIYVRSASKEESESMNAREERVSSVIRIRFDKFLLCAVMFLVVVSLSGLASLAQSSTPAATADAQVSPQVAPVKPAVPAQEAPRPPITILEDTLIRVQTIEPVNSKRVKEGSPVLFMVNEGVLVGDVLAIPRGAMVRGRVIESKKAGRLTGSPELSLQLTSLELGGRSYPLDSYQFKVTGASKTRPTENKVIRGTYVGALAGAFSNPRMGGTAAGRAASVGTDATIGAGVGTLVAAVTPGPGIWIPSEAEVDFYLAAPVTVTPVSAKEAARLAQGLHSGGPNLYLRGDAQ
jgi:hypothetical protein